MPKLAHYGNHFLHNNYGIKPELQNQHSLLFYRVTDVPFLPKWTNEPKLDLGIDLGENAALRRYGHGNCAIVVSIKRAFKSSL